MFHKFLVLLLFVIYLFLTREWGWEVFDVGGVFLVTFISYYIILFYFMRGYFS